MVNKKGFTTVELVVSFALTAIIVLFLFRLVFVLKDLYVLSGIKIKLLTKQATINSLINDDFTSKKITLATKIDNKTIKFYFSDGTNKELTYDKADDSITYGDYKTNLISGSEFGNITITTEVNTSTNDTTTLNGILYIKIPVYHSLIEKEDFGVDAIYLYNSNYASLSGLNITDIVDAEKQIYLINETTVAFEDIAFTDPGYYVLNTTNSQVTQNDPDVVVTGNVDTSKIGNYYLTYTLYDMNGNVMSQAIRTVNVIKSEYTFAYTGGRQSFNVPINGKYKIETWGASGGGTMIMSGKGGYTVGEYDLTSADQLFIYVGGTGSLSTASNKATGGYNGGGDSGVGAIFAGSGGGSTDIRLNTDSLASRIFVAGGGGGAGSRNDSTIICTGGVGGGTAGETGKCSANSYLGGAGTQSSGGAAATYNTNIITSPTTGTLGIGGIGASYSDGTTSYSAGGGGGGYYGGGGGARYGGGGGGSGYCSVSSCTTNTGTEVFTSIDGKNYETGHNGNGYAKITLISIN